MVMCIMLAANLFAINNETKVIEPVFKQVLKVKPSNSGELVATFTVTENGEIKDIEVDRSHELSKYALLLLERGMVVEQPLILDGRPTEARVRMPLLFK